MGSYLLRLVEKARAEGQVAGTAEAVETGEVVPFRNADDLVALLLAPRGVDHPNDNDRPT